MSLKGLQTYLWISAIDLVDKYFSKYQFFNLLQLMNIILFFFRKLQNKILEEKSRTIDHDHNYFNSVINCFSYQDSKLFCDFCPYETQTYRAIVRHLKRHRTCWKCSKRFFGSKLLWKRHTKSCNGLKKETSICQFCKKDFIFPSKLKKHLYKCELKHTLLKTHMSIYDLWYLL